MNLSIGSGPCLGKTGRGLVPFQSFHFSQRLSHSQQFQGLTAKGVKGQSYNVEIECDENEDPEGVFKRFRNECNQAGMVYEARKRQYFENKQDIIKRKQQEKGMRKQRAMRERFLQTYGESHSETPPFSDLFQGQDDIYDIIGSMSDSYDEDRSMYNRRQARNNNSARNSLASSAAAPKEEEATPVAAAPASDPSIIRRSVKSEGPASNGSSGPQSDAPKQKQRAKFQTAKTRRQEKIRAPARV